MIAYAIATFVIAAGSFVAGAFYGKKWEQQVVADLVKAYEEGSQAGQGVYDELKNRVSKYL